MQQNAITERRALSETLRRVGPDSATLCGEWTTAQLTAHLVLRERSIVELGGQVPVPALQRRAERALDELVAREPYERLVDTFAAGPWWRDVRGPVPVAWFWSLPPVTELANLLEYVIHHEDVRRTQPGWEPRVLPLEVQMTIWKRLQLVAHATLRKVPVGVTLAWAPHGVFRTRRAQRHGTAVTVAGDAVELALFAYGRGPQARVHYSGNAEDVDAVQGADISL